MNYQNIPVVKYFIASEDEDYLTADNETSFEQTDELLNKTREERPSQIWSMFAEIDA